MWWKKFKHKRNKNAESGQAMIEFVLGLMIVFSFFFFYVKMAAVFAVGNYIHYATFMSARAYLASGESEESQRNNAETVMKKMIGDRFKSVVKSFECDQGCAENVLPSVSGGRVGLGPWAKESLTTDFWNQGSTYSFKASLSLYPWNREGDSLTMKLVSESWLGREESASECEQRKLEIKGAIAVPNARMEWDNGC